MDIFKQYSQNKNQSILVPFILNSISATTIALLISTTFWSLLIFASHIAGEFEDQQRFVSVGIRDASCHFSFNACNKCDEFQLGCFIVKAVLVSLPKVFALQHRWHESTPLQSKYHDTHFSYCNQQRELIQPAGYRSLVCISMQHITRQRPVFQVAASKLRTSCKMQGLLVTRQIGESLGKRMQKSGNPIRCKHCCESSQRGALVQYFILHPSYLKVPL